MTKKNVFLQAARTLYQRARPAMWRTLYRTMHTIRYSQDMSTFWAAWEMGKIGLLMHQRGRSSAKVAREIRKYLFNALIENADHITPTTYHLATFDQRYHMVIQLTQHLHAQMSVAHPDVAPSLTSVTFRPDQDGNKKKWWQTDALYSPAKKQIVYYTHILDHSFNDVINTIIHEYTHVLQNARHSAMPNFILEFQAKHPKAYIKTPYIIRPDENEAWRMGSWISRNFDKHFFTYLEKHARE
ncbi:MAG: hypothetical protein K2L95_03020 [Alphaproteobacteria bacterium]|nr:hypothetical protein [Alphaproteobacteria bacterium]